MAAVDFGFWIGIVASYGWRVVVAAAITFVIWVAFDEMFPGLPSLRLRDIIFLLVLSYLVTWVITLLYRFGRSAVSSVRRRLGC